MIDEEGLNKVVKRFMADPRVTDMELSEGEVREILISLAKQWGGCINCIYSEPPPEKWGEFRWTSRSCVLKLAQGTCGVRKPFLT